MGLDTYDSYTIVHVNNEGEIKDSGASYATPLGIRPAVIVPLYYILMISAAEGGKSDSVGGLSTISAYDGDEWKLTAIDYGHSFTVTKATTNPSGDAIDVQYTGASVGDNEYISAILTDKQDNLLYYGKVQKPETADGTVTISIPEELAKGNYILRVFREQYNGDYATDSASNPQKIEFTVGSDAISVGRAIVLGSDPLQKGVNTTAAATLYFGRNEVDNPAPWRVSGYNGSGAFGSEGTATLLSANLMGTTKFDDGVTFPVANTHYSTSTLRDAILVLADKLTDPEKAAVIGHEAVDGEPFWPLSTDEAYLTDEGLLASTDDWWLRTSRDGSYVATVDDSGFVDVGWPVSYEEGIRPAFYLDLNSILFTSAATGIKSGTVGALSPLTDYVGTEWKLTLRDTARSGFTAELLEPSVSPGGTITVTYSGAKLGEGEYVSALLVDRDGIVQGYGHVAFNTKEGTGTLSIPDDIAYGRYTLYVFSEQCNGDNKTDYASDFKEFSLDVVELQQGTTLPASFTATGEDSGILSDVNASMEYSVDGGTSWHSVTGDSMTITGVTAEHGVKVRRNQSDPGQTIQITQASQPTAVSGTDCTTSAQNDGQITGVNGNMEYKLSGESDWTSITGSEVTDLANGTYEVRIKANGTVLASPAATVIIAAHTCVAVGDWEYDETGHWHECSSCGEKTDEAEHSWNAEAATEEYDKHCTICGYVAEEKLKHTHTYGTEWKSDETGHWHECSSCGAKTDEAEHSWNAEAATEEHDKHCTICGYVAEEKLEHTHTYGTEWKSDETGHWHECSSCGAKTDEAEHSWNAEAATEEHDKHCTICGYVAEEKLEHTHTYGTEWKSDATGHWHECSSCGAKTDEAEHSWNAEAATEEHDKHCTICGYVAEEKLEHTHTYGTEWKSDETGHWHECSSCGAKTDEAEHSWNAEAATEEHDKHCTICGYVAEEKLEHTHTYGTEWKSDATGHWHECSSCGVKSNVEAHTYDDDRDSTCNVCGYVRPAAPPADTEYTVNFNANGGNVSPSSTITTDGKLTGLPTPTRNGYDFVGWYTATSGGQPVTTGTEFTQNTTIYALWKVRESGGSSGGGNSGSSGSTTETTQNPDGSTTTVTRPDGSTTETTEKPDGSQEVVKTDKDGTVTTTTTDPEGNKTEIVEKTDGSSQTTVTNEDGSSSVTASGQDGQSETQVKLPDAVTDNAEEKGEAVTAAYACYSCCF